MNYEEWVAQLPEVILNSPLWTMTVYRKALFLYDLVWRDCEGLMRDRRGRAIAEQLIRSAGSICANIEEGYGRGFGRQYAQFLGYSLGSARETQGWYHRSRHLLPPDIVHHRLTLLDEIIALLVVTQNQQRRYRSPSRP